MRDRHWISIHWALWYALTSIPLLRFNYHPEDIIEFILIDWLKKHREEMDKGLLNLDCYIDHYEHCGKASFDELMKRYEQLEKDDIDPEPKEDANGGKINLWRKNNENDIHAE